MGKHILPFHRNPKGVVKTSQAGTMLSLFKNPTMMQSAEVKVECLDLFHTAADCFLRDYRLKNPDVKEKLQCVIPIHTSRGASGHGAEFYAAVANMMTMGKHRVVLDKIHMGNKDRRASIARKNVCVDCNGGDNPDIPKDALLYRTKASAKGDLLWYIATRNNNASRWICEKFPKQQWTVMSKQDSSARDEDITLGNPNNEGANAFLLLTLENRPSKHTDGNIFCSLMYGQTRTLPLAIVKKGCVLASFFDNTKDHCVFPMVCGDLNLKDTPLPLSKNQDAAIQSDFNDKHILPTHANTILLDDIHNDTSHVLPQSSITKRPPKEGESRVPLPVDVFLSMNHRHSLHPITRVPNVNGKMETVLA
jgi:hypothetical protein